MPFLPGSKLPQLLQTEQTFKSKATIYAHTGKECDRKENSPQKFLNLSKNSKGQRRHGFPFFKPVPGGAGWHGIKASLTLEAAIALPVMIFALYLLMFPIKVMDAERRLQNSMEAAAEKLAAELAEKKVVIKTKSGEGGRLFGSITSKDISDAIKDQLGMDIDKKKIQMKAAVKQTGHFDVEIKLYQGVKGNLSVDIVSE